MSTQEKLKRLDLRVQSTSADSLAKVACTVNDFISDDGVTDAHTLHLLLVIFKK